VRTVVGKRREKERELAAILDKSPAITVRHDVKEFREIH